MGVLLPLLALLSSGGRPVVQMTASRASSGPWFSAPELHMVLHCGWEWTAKGRMVSRRLRTRSGMCKAHVGHKVGHVLKRLRTCLVPDMPEPSKVGHVQW